MRGSMSGAMPDAGVPHPQHRLAALPLGGQPDVAAVLGVLGGVVEQVRRRPAPAGRVGVRPTAARAAGATVSSWPAASMSRLGRLHRAGDDVASSTGSLRSSILPRDDAGHVEQVIDQPDHVLHLPLHHLPRPLDDGGVRPRQLQDVQGVADRGQRVAQFVGQHAPGTRPCGGRPPALR